MPKPELKIVPLEPQKGRPYNEAKAVARIARAKLALAEAVIHWVKNSQTSNLPERIRQASDLSGIPRSLIEVALPKDSKS